MSKVCPLCGSSNLKPHATFSWMVVCGACGKIVTPKETSKYTCNGDGTKPCPFNTDDYLIMAGHVAHNELHGIHVVDVEIGY